MLADRTDTPELAISEGEARELCDRASNVLRHYSVEASQKAIDWTMFAVAVGGVYIPRVVAISIRHRQAPSSGSPVAGPQARPAAPKPNGAAGPARTAAPPRPAAPEAPPTLEIDFTNNAPDQDEP